MKRRLGPVESDFAKLFPERTRHPPEGFRVGETIGVSGGSGDAADLGLRMGETFFYLLDLARGKVVPAGPAVRLRNDLGEKIELIASAAHGEGLPEVAEQVFGDRGQNVVQQSSPVLACPSRPAAGMGNDGIRIPHTGATSPGRAGSTSAVRDRRVFSVQGTRSGYGAADRGIFPPGRQACRQKS